jgi:hypothetical protein
MDVNNAANQSYVIFTIAFLAIMCFLVLLAVICITYFLRGKPTEGIAAAAVAAVAATVPTAPAAAVAATVPTAPAAAAIRDPVNVQRIANLEAQSAKNKETITNLKRNLSEVPPG